MWRTPTVLVTGGSILVGLVILVLVLLRPGTGNNAGPVTVPTSSIPAGLASGRTLGSATAPVTIDVWTDYQCPYCGLLARLIEPRLVTEFVVPGTAKIVAHDFSFIGQGRNPDESTDAAVAARSAEKQGKYWEYRDYLYWNQHNENAGDFVRSRLLAMATALKLDQAAFTTSLDDQTIRSAVAAETAQGSAMGIKQTPTLVINGRIYTGELTYDAIATAVRAAAAERAAGGSPSPVPSGASTAP